MSLPNSVFTTIYNMVYLEQKEAEAQKLKEEEEAKKDPNKKVTTNIPYTEDAIQEMLEENT